MISIDEEIVWNVPLQGPAFNFDSKTVLILLKELCNGTNINTWIKGIRCGRAAIQALHQNYDRYVESDKRIQ